MIIDQIANEIFELKKYEYESYQDELSKYKENIKKIHLNQDEISDYIEKIGKIRKTKRHLAFIYSLILLDFYNDYELLYLSSSLALNINYNSYPIQQLSEIIPHIDKGNDLYSSILTILAKSYRNAGNLEESLNYFKSAQQAYIAKNDKFNEGWMIYSIGKMYLNYLQQPTRSIDLLHKAKKIFDEIDNDRKYRGVSACLDELGDVYRQGLKDYEKAITFYNEAVSLNKLEKSYYPAGLSRNYCHLGLCYWHLGNLQNAEMYLSMGLEILDKIPGQEKGMGIRLTQLGKVKIDSNSKDLGYKNLLRGQEFNTQYHNSEYIIYNLIYQGDYYFHKSDINKALSIYQDAIEKSRNTLFYDLTSISFNKAANCYFRLNLFNESRLAFIESIESNIKYWENMKKGTPNSSISDIPELGEMYQSLFYKLNDVYATDLKKAVFNLDSVYDALISEYEQQKRNYENILRFGNIMSGIKHEIQNLHNDVISVIDDVCEEKYLSNENLILLSQLRIKIHEKSNILSNRNLKEIISNIDKPLRLKKRVFEGIIDKITSDFRLSNIAFEKLVEDFECFLTIDEVSIKYILLNILLNSKEAFEISFTEEQRKIGIKSFLKDKQYVVIIYDNAGGILEENFEKIFDFGFTTKLGSTGYGLPSILSLMKSFNGKIDVKNNSYSGLTTTLKFPII